MGFNGSLMLIVYLINGISSNPHPRGLRAPHYPQRYKMNEIQKYIKQLEAEAIEAYRIKDLEELKRIGRLLAIAQEIANKLEQNKEGTK